MIKNSRKPEQLEKARAKAREHGGQCLTTEYTHARQLMTWQCKHKTFQATFHDVVHQKHWCDKCYLEAKLARAHRAAEERGGKCLSTAYKGCKAKMEFKCSNPNHAPWTAKYTSVVNDGHWCAKCYEEGRKPKA